jgi:glycosyltransferase involved in cell wall biosynthesis
MWVGALGKGALYATLRRSIALVAPSRTDNLPNTVIESLMVGVPVIGTSGASIDELVEDGVNGELVPCEDVRALADALVANWRGEGRLPRAPMARVKVLDALEPSRAVAAFFDLVDEIRGAPADPQGRASRSCAPRATTR